MPLIHHLVHGQLHFEQVCLGYVRFDKQPSKMLGCFHLLATVKRPVTMGGYADLLFMFIKPTNSLRTP